MRYHAVPWPRGNVSPGCRVQRAASIVDHLPRRSFFGPREGLIEGPLFWCFLHLSRSGLLYKVPGCFTSLSPFSPPRRIAFPLAVQFSLATPAVLGTLQTSVLDTILLYNSTSLAHNHSAAVAVSSLSHTLSSSHFFCGCSQASEPFIP